MVGCPATGAKLVMYLNVLHNTNNLIVLIFNVKCFLKNFFDSVMRLAVPDAVPVYIVRQQLQF